MGPSGSGKTGTLHGSEGLLTKTVNEILEVTTPFTTSTSIESQLLETKERTFLRTSVYIIN
jgi:ABC-type lipoprotein export system ATPase subunit